MRSPRDNKDLSYARDGRNTYSENDKASRKAIPARKAGENRHSRRKASQALGCFVSTSEPEADVVESSLSHDVERVGGWRKRPDTPLGVVLSRKSRDRDG